MDMDPGYILGEIDEDGIDLPFDFFDSDSEEDAFLQDLTPSESDVNVPKPAFDKVCHTSLPVEVWERIMMHMTKDGIQTMSQVSRQHHALTKAVAFRSRYFLSQGMRCQAVFKASCFKKLFTPELLRCLLNMGAIMSRYFVQTFSLSHQGWRPIRGRGKWADSLPTTVYLAVIAEGVAMYGDTLKLTGHNSESSTITAWVNHSTRSLVFEDAIKEIFVEGRYAPFTTDDSYSGYGGSLISSSVSKHPDLVDILEQNGYTFTKQDRDAIISDIFRKSDAKEEELYQEVDLLLSRFPNWAISLSCCTHLLTRSFGPDFNAMPHTEEGRQILAENDGVGPVSAPFKVMRRLYLEGKAFKDLDTKLVGYFNLDLKERDYCHVHVAEYRLFYRHFPEILAGQRLNLALAYISAYKHKLSSATTGPDQKVLRQSLFEMLEELNLKPVDMVKVFSDIRITSKLLHHALKAGLFGSDWSENIDKILRSLMNHCIEQPRSGKRLQEIETVVTELYRVPVGKAQRDHQLITKDFFTQELHSLLCTWAFDLDLLRPDKKNATEAKFRTSIGWFIGGGFRMPGRHYSIQCATPYSDIYRLIPAATTRSMYDNRTMETYFAHTQGQCYDYGGLEEDDDESILVESPGKVAEQPRCTGWVHLGRMEDIMKEAAKEADDSGVCLVDNQEETGDHHEEPAEVSAAATGPSSNKEVSKAKVGPKLGLYHTVPMKINRSYCCNRDRDSYCGRSCPQEKGHELALTLQDMLPSDSPAMRDVLLSHALVNGNSVLVQRLMAGVYAPEAGKINAKKVKKEPSSSQTTASESTTTSTSTTATTNKGPILPTLAHLRILQALERRPVSTFTSRIMDGAPFKRGYVKSSSISVNAKEEDAERRLEMYQQKGHKDDRPMTALYEEKTRLEEVDRVTKQKARKKSAKAAAAKRKGRRSTTSRVETEEDEEDFKVILDNSLLDAASQSRPQRSTRKMVRYNEPGSNSSDVEDIITYTKKGDSSKKIDVMDMFEDGMDLTDVESDGVDEPHQSTSDRIMDESDGSETEENEEEHDALRLQDKDVPMVEFKVDLTSYRMSLSELIRRSKSISLWSEHLRLLEWFEKRKDKLLKEKLAKARKEQETRERALKNDFFKWLEVYVREVDALKEMMERESEKAIAARKKSLIRKKQSAKLMQLKKGDNSTKRGRVSRKRLPKNSVVVEIEVEPKKKKAGGVKRKRLLVDMVEDSEEEQGEGSSCEITRVVQGKAHAKRVRREEQSEMETNNEVVEDPEGGESSILTRVMRSIRRS